MVRGRVQGVGYRYSTLRRAEDLGLTGWVRNNPDGTVQGHTRGQVDRVDAFANWLWQGPTYAKVSHVQIDEIQDDEIQDDCCSDFEIRR